MEPLHTEVYKDHTIKIYSDDYPQNPRKEWDNFGHMVCFHGKYDLGDKHDLRSEDFSGWDEMEKHLRKELGAEVILPLYLLDHSGITMRTGSFNDPWDSGQVGFIYSTRADILKEFKKKIISKALRKRVENLLEGEVKTYDQYLTGDVYGFNIKSPFEGTEDDSCYGFFGFDECLQEAKSIVDFVVKKMDERMKTMYAAAV